MRLLNKILSLAASAAIMLTGYSTPASAQTDPVSSLEAVAGIQNTDVHFVKIAAGDRRYYALDSEGYAWAWGSDKLGCDLSRSECADQFAIGGNSNDVEEPQRVRTDVKFTEIATSNSFTLAIDTDGHLWKWGRTDSGPKSSENHKENWHWPEMVLSDHKFKSLSGDMTGIVALDENGHIWKWFWGSSYNGEIEFDKEFVSAVNNGRDGILAVDCDGILFQFKNDQNSSDNENVSHREYPVRVDFNKKVKQIGYEHRSLFELTILDEEGCLWKKEGDQDNFILVNKDMRFTQISSGSGSMDYAISDEGNLYKVGRYDRSLKNFRIERIETEKKVVHVSTGPTAAIFIVDDSGMTWVFGSDLYIAGGHCANSEKPVKLLINTKFTQISASGNHAAALDESGNIWIWGEYQRKENGYGLRKNLDWFLFFPPYNAKYTKVSVGAEHILALDSDGHVWGLGSNKYGQLKEEEERDCYSLWMNNLFENTEYADLVFTDIYAGATLSMAVDSDGNTWQWGTGEAETPAGSADPGYAPGMPSTSKNYVQTAAGRDHVLCLDDSGVIWSWGKDDYGQLGHCTDEKYCNPEDKYRVDVYKDDVKFSQVAAGDGFSVALDTEGRIWTWGRNDKGQLGNYVSASKRETPGYVFR